MRIYLDSCCVNRVFDDPAQERVRLEAASITAILNRVQMGDWKWISSTIVETEVAAIDDFERWSQTWRLLDDATQCVALSNEIKTRAAELETLGIRSFDALHVACAEFSGADVFLTTDDQLLHGAERAGNKLKVLVANPLPWFTQVMTNERNNVDDD